MSEATFSNKGLMGTFDKSFMPYPFPTSGSKIFLIADINRYQRVTSLIITSPNNNETAGLFILNAGHGTNTTPGLKKIIGYKMAGRIFYKLDGAKMKIYYQCPSADGGPLDIFVSLQNQNGSIKYSEYSGSTEDMTEIVLTD